MRVYNLLSRQRDDILICEPLSVLQDSLKPPPNEGLRHISVRRVPLNRGGLLSRVPYVSYFRSVREGRRRYLASVAGERIDVVHGHNPLRFGLLSQALAHDLKTPLIYEAHGLNVDAYRILISRWNPAFLAGYAYVKRKEGRLLNSSAHVICLTRALKERIQNVFGISGRKITVVPNGVDGTRFAPISASEVSRLRVQVGASGKIVMYAGYMDRVNGIVDLERTVPRIISRIPDITFLFMGHGPEQGRVLALRQRYPNNVRVSGMVPYDDMPAYYQICDVFVVPRPPTMHGEIITPLKLLEAMAMEKPVLGSNVGGIAEVIRDGDNGYLFKKGDMEDFEEVLVKVLHTDNTRVGKNARQAVVENHSWDRSANILQEVYSGLI